MGSINQVRQLLFPDPVMKIEQFVTLGVLAVMCSPVQSQSQGGTLARPTPPPQASQLLQQSGVSALRLIPGGGPHFVYDSRCNVWREVHSKRDCPMAFDFGIYQRLCSDFDLATDSADIVYQAYTYNAARGDRFCRYTHACVACPIVNERCPPFFRGRRSESDDEDSELNNNDSEVDEVDEVPEVPEEW